MLRANMERAFGSAKSWWWALLGADALMIGVSYITAVVRDGWWAAATGLAVVVLVARVAVGRKQSATYTRGEEIRRVHLVADSLGRPIRANEALHLRLDTTLEGSTAPYFASKQDTGPRRLCENVAESAFFTARNSRVAGGVMLAVWVVLFAITTYVVWVAAGTISTEVASWLRLMPPMAAFLVSGHLLKSASGFQTLGTESGRVYTEAVRLSHETDGPPLGDVLLLLSSYGWHLARSAPIPTQVHVRLNAANNRDWEEHGRVKLPSLGASADEGPSDGK